MEKSKVIFGNKISDGDYRSAVKGMRKFAKKYGDDREIKYPAVIQKNPYIRIVAVLKGVPR